MDLSNITLTENDITRIEKLKKKYVHMSNRREYKILEELYKMVVVEQISTKDIALYYNVGVRSVQMWLKSFGLNRTLKHSARIKVINSRQPVEITPENSSNPTYLLERIKSLDYEAMIYRMLDSKGKVLYIGKTVKGNHKDHNTTREYNIKQRLYVHFYSKKRVIPVEVYKAVRKIDYIICSTDEVLELEGSLILSYKFDGQCMWNGQFPTRITAGINNIEWTELITFNHGEIELLQQLR